VAFKVVKSKKFLDIKFDKKIHGYEVSKKKNGSDL